MSTLVIDVTLLAIVEEINHVLETSTYRSYQVIFSMPDFRQELIAYTLNHVHNRYRVIDECN